MDSQEEKMQDLVDIGFIRFKDGIPIRSVLFFYYFLLFFYNFWADLFITYMEPSK